MKRQGFPVSGLNLSSLTTVLNTITAGTTAPIGLGVMVTRTADTTARTNNTLANDDATGGQLKFAIGASATERYFVEAFLIFNSANVTMDAKVGWNATGLPAGATASWGGIGTGGGGATIPGFGSSVAATTCLPLLAIGATIPLGGANNGDFGALVGGTILGGGTAGNIILAWAQNTTDAGNLVLKAGSCLRVTKEVA